MRNKMMNSTSDNKKITRICDDFGKTKSPNPSGFRVRVDIHAGAWLCNSCVGETEGSQLLQPNCGYCQIA